MLKPFVRALRRMFVAIMLAVAVAVAVAVAPVAAGQQEVAALMQSRLEALADGDLRSVRGESLAGIAFILEFYTRRTFAPAWGNEQRTAEILELIERTWDEGLDPADYHLGPLRSLTDEDDSGPATVVDRDILLTDALLRLGAHLRFGKVDPVGLDGDWNIARETTTDDPVGLLQDAIDSPSLEAFIAERIPRQPFYQRLKDALTRYRAIAAAGGWPEVPGGPALKPGTVDQRVPLVRARLAAEGDLAAAKPDGGKIVDERLIRAVRAFQRRHALEPDGVVGPRTLAAMNVPVVRRIAQIRANLERSRWIFTDLTGDFLVVNIAGYDAYFVRDDELVWHTDVMVGRPYRQTPVFKAQIEYLVLNPTWTVPPGILRKDILPRQRRDPAYLERAGLQLLDSNGRLVDPASVDWQAVRAGGFPYTVRQPAGPDNALGRVKFVFPNSHLVFLHDTNHRELFANRERAFSSGCIRVREPMQLAELLLAEDPRWTREALDRAVSTGRTRTIFLPRPLPILLLYWTTRVTADGTVTFLHDPYGRDQRIVDGLTAASPGTAALIEP